MPSGGHAPPRKLLAWPVNQKVSIVTIKWTEMKIVQYPFLMHLSDAKIA